MKGGCRPYKPRRASTRGLGKEKLKDKLLCDLAHPHFFSSPRTGVNPLRGFIRPALRAKGLRPVETLNTRLLLDTHAGKL